MWYGVSVFWAVVVVGIAAGFLAIIGHFHLQEGDPTKQPINVGTSLVILAGLAIAGSLYHVASSFARSYRHLAEMARHRATVGRTYKAFHASADDKTKQAVHLTVLTALITADRTGFIKREGDAGDETIVETAARLLGKGS